MPNYTPPPPTLDHLNPIQRYMQKGQLEKHDYIWLVGFVIIYFMARPYLQSAAKWYFNVSEVNDGEKAQKEYFERRRVANAVRGVKDDKATEEILGDEPAAASGAKVDGENKVVNRKNKGASAAAVPKSVEEQLLDWDDEPERKASKDDKSDVVTWLNRWDE